MNSEQRQTDGRPSSGSAASPYSGLDYNNPANPYLWLNAATNPAAAASLGIVSNEKFNFYKKWSENFLKKKSIFHVKISHFKFLVKNIFFESNNFVKKYSKLFLV